MTSILPPPKRQDFKSEKAYKEAYNDWKKMFVAAMKAFNSRRGY